MKQNQLTPPMVLMLAFPSRVSGMELMKVSLLDLLYRGVLEVFQEWRLPHHRSTDERLYTLVCKGPQFQSYQPNPYQDPFVQPFRETEIEIQLPLLIRMVYDESKGFGRYKRKGVYAALRKLKLMRHSLTERANIYVPTSKGQKLKHQYRHWIRKANQVLPELMKNAPQKLPKLIQQLGSLVLLLPSLNPANAKTLLQILEQKEEQIPPNTLHFLQNAVALNCFSTTFDAYFHLGPRGTNIEITKDIFEMSPVMTAPRLLFGAKKKS